MGTDNKRRTQRSRHKKDTVISLLSVHCYASLVGTHCTIRPNGVMNKTFQFDSCFTTVLHYVGVLYSSSSSSSSSTTGTASSFLVVFTFRSFSEPAGFFEGGPASSPSSLSPSSSASSSEPSSSTLSSSSSSESSSASLALVRFVFFLGARTHEITENVYTATATHEVLRRQSRPLHHRNRNLQTRRICGV